MTTTLKDLSEEQLKAALNNLEKRTLEQLPIGFDLPTRFEPKDKLLLRFLKSWQGNVEEAANLLADHIRWRNEHRVDEIAQKSVDELFEGRARAKDIANHMPIIERGEDNEQRPVLYLIASKLDARAANRLISPQKVYEYQIWLRERALARLDLYGAGKWRSPPYYTIVVDLRGVKLNQATGEFYSLMRRITDLDQYHYPGRVGSMIIINVPFFFQMIWGALKGWIGSSAEKKIIICYRDTEAKRVLASAIPPARLPSDLGGNAIPLPSARMGSSEDFFCSMVHFSKLTMITQAERRPPSDTSGSAEYEDAQQRIQLDSIIRESMERSRLGRPIEGQEVTSLADRRASLGHYKSRLQAGKELESLKEDLMQAIHQVEQSTNEFEKDMLITRARLRRRLARLSSSSSPYFYSGTLLPVGKEALRQALGVAKDELEAHSRAVAFARNYIDVEAQQWQNEQRALRARLDRVLDEHRGLSRTVEVALGKQVLDDTLRSLMPSTT